jgi:hypothetical protein
MLSNAHSFTFNGTGGNDTMIVSLANGQPLVPGSVSFNGGPGSNILTLDAHGNPVRTVQGALTGGDPQTVGYSNVQTTNVNNAAAANAFGGPDTADRGAAFTGLSPTERFVQAVYLDELGRVGAKAELDAWASMFSGFGPDATVQTAIATGIEHTQEARDHLVKSWYLAYLGRQAVGGEEQGWVNLLLAGQTEEQVLSKLLSDPVRHEFYDRAKTLGLPGDADHQYVGAIFNVLLNRTGSTSEVATWVNALPSLGRQGVALGILKTPEFRTYQFEGYYNALLHRPDDPQFLSEWVMSNLDIGAVRIGFESGPEFFTNG